MADNASSWDTPFQNSFTNVLPNVNTNAGVPVPTSGAPLPPPSRPRKAKQHRKRHAPAGPAGLFFQQQSQVSALSLPSKRRNHSRHPSYSESPEEDDDDAADATQKPLILRHDGASFYSPAWMAMQIDLNLRTPSLPAYLQDTDKYNILRPLYPDSYLLLPDILQGLADWRSPSHKQLLVLVETTQALTDNLWTVSLTDETGSSLQAWIQPSLAKQEQQHAKFIVPGRVWLLHNTTIMLVPSRKKQKKKMTRMILITAECIVNMWSPQSLSQVSDEAYTQWAEERNTLTASVMERIMREKDKENGVSSSKDGVVELDEEDGSIVNDRRGQEGDDEVEAEGPLMRGGEHTVVQEVTAVNQYQQSLQRPAPPLSSIQMQGQVTSMRTTPTMPNPHKQPPTMQERPRPPPPQQYCTSTTAGVDQTSGNPSSPSVSVPPPVINNSHSAPSQPTTFAPNAELTSAPNPDFSRFAAARTLTSPPPPATSQHPVLSPKQGFSYTQQSNRQSSVGSHDPSHSTPQLVATQAHAFKEGTSTSKKRQSVSNSIKKKSQMSTASVSPKGPSNLWSMTMDMDLMMEDDEDGDMLDDSDHAKIVQTNKNDSDSEKCMVPPPIKTSIFHPGAFGDLDLGGFSSEDE